MALSIFLALNGLAVTFLVYVLLNFWKEGRRSARRFADRSAAAEDWPSVAVITHPISHAAQGGVSVIPFPLKGEESGANLTQSSALARKAANGQVRRISTR